jgi:Protein of unknown function DUF115
MNKEVFPGIVLTDESARACTMIETPGLIRHGDVPVSSQEFAEALGGSNTPMVIEIGAMAAVESLRPRTELDEFIKLANAEIDVGCNTQDDTFLENVRINSHRPDVPWLHVVPDHYEHAIIVGGGPSLEITLFEVASRKMLGQTLFALNGAGKYLKDRHFDVDALVLSDSRESAVKFVKELPARRYFISSGCHPKVFDFLLEKRADVMLFHMPHLRLAEMLPKGVNVVMIGGEYTVGLTAISLACALGFRNVHLYGYDSSDADDGRPHAYLQDRTEAEKERLLIRCAGRQFSCSFPMAKQAEVFPEFAAKVADFGCTLTVNGDGLLPHLAKQWVSFSGPENAACYNMTDGPASFDFITWLVNAEMDRVRRNAPSPLLVAFTPGPEEGFRPADVQNTPEKQQILDHVMRPALKLFGAVESDKAVGGRQFHYWYRPVTDGFRCGEKVPRCKPPVESVLDVTGWLYNRGIFKNDALVITLRETRYSQERNSDVEAWLEFARRRRAEGRMIVFVRDTAKADDPLEDFLICPQAAKDLHFRAALYSLAKCNLIIANGPAELLQFSDWPFIEFKPSQIDPTRPVSLGISWWQRFGGITPPESFPWLGKHQLTVWQRDTVENIEAAWLRWRAATAT